jgi:hypothetical protein
MAIEKSVNFYNEHASTELKLALENSDKYKTNALTFCMTSCHLGSDGLTDFALLLRLHFKTSTEMHKARSKFRILF